MARNALKKTFKELNITNLKMKSNLDVVILTGNELRHKFFFQVLINDSRFNIIKCFAEDASQSLEARIFSNKNSSEIEKKHVLNRKKSEKEFFSSYIKNKNFYDNIFKVISSGSVNNKVVVDEIISCNPDIIVSFGCSLIKSKLLKIYKNKFLNVHLGLSPYYRGSGTNVWPLINNEIEMVGLTFMYIDEGIDTGKIIHQKRAEIYEGDDPHMIGNRLIRDMAYIYSDIIANFEMMHGFNQISADKEYLYTKKDFDEYACNKLYKNFSDGIVENYIENYKKINFLPIIENPILKARGK